jgi:hypothetical protein
MAENNVSSSTAAAVDVQDKFVRIILLSRKKKFDLTTFYTLLGKGQDTIYSDLSVGTILKRKGIELFNRYSELDPKLRHGVSLLKAQ